MIYYKGNRNHLVVTVFTSSLLASLLIVNSSIVGQGLRASATIIKTTNNTQVGSMVNNMTLSSTVKKILVGDIDIAYKIFGKGKPLLLIAGAGATMDAWDPMVLRKLSANHTVIVFDNRGIGQTSAGTIKNFTISQYANDTASLLDALQIRSPVDVLGHSLGSFIAQELTLMHPNKVNKLTLFASNCGGRDAIPGTPEVSADFAKLANPNFTSTDQALIIGDLMFPSDWKKDHPNYLSYLPPPKEPISPKTVVLQGQAVANWKGSCERLSNITKPTLVITGTDDIVRPPANSIMLAEKIPGAWLVQIKGGGHGVMYQYPQQFTAVLETFLSIT